MDFVTGVIGAILTLVAVGLVIGLVAYMFPIIFSLGTILDKRIHDQ
jgi:fucose permease